MRARLHSFLLALAATALVSCAPTPADDTPGTEHAVEADGGDATRVVTAPPDATAPAVGDGGTDAAPPQPTPPRRVGLFVGNGAGQEYTTAVSNVLAPDARFVLTKFSDGSVDFGTLDVVVMPGGSASTQWKALGATGQKNLRAFVSGGGGYIGVCAGFYLALSSTAGFVEAQHYEPWARGEGQVQVKIASGNGVFTTTGTHPLRYVNGPVVHPPANAGQPGYAVLATFAGNIGQSDIVSMTGKPAIVASEYGQGRVVAFSPHPELSGLGELLADAGLWAAPR